MQGRFGRRQKHVDQQHLTIGRDQQKSQHAKFDLTMQACSFTLQLDSCEQVHCWDAHLLLLQVLLLTHSSLCCHA